MSKKDEERDDEINENNQKVLVIYVYFDRIINKKSKNMDFMCELNYNIRRS